MPTHIVAVAVVVARTLVGSASSSVRPETIDGSDTDIVVLCPSNPDAAALSNQSTNRSIILRQHVTAFAKCFFTYRRMFAACNLYREIC